MPHLKATTVAGPSDLVVACTDVQGLPRHTADAHLHRAILVGVVRTQSDIDAAGDADLARHLRRYSRKLTMAITATLIVGALGLVYLASKRAGAFSETTGNYREIGAIS